MTFAYDPETHIYKVNGEVWPSVTQILKDMGFVDTTWFNDYARERGSFVHDTVKWQCQGVLDEDTVDDVLRPYLDAWRLFVADTGFVSEKVEEPLYSPRYGFAGTPDQIGKLYNTPSVIDYKTGAMDPVTGLQLSGYEVLEHAQDSGYRILKRYGLQLTDKGKYKLTPFKDRTDRQVFLSALACWTWQRNH